jgi:hypothetical protein
LLFRITHYFKPESILELGLHRLAASAYLWKSKAKITTLEAVPKRLKLPKTNLVWLTNVNSVTTEFKNYLKNSQLSIINYQLIYFDGNHSKKTP